MIDNDTKTLDGSARVENDLEIEIKARVKLVDAHYEKWDVLAKEDYQFALGDQWSAADLETLKKQGRPALTFNRIRPIINIVSGYQRENSARIKVNPEGGEDTVFSEVMDRGLRAMGKWSHLEYKMGYWFDDGCYCGKGYLEAIISYDKDPIRGQIIFKQRSPYQIRPDPECLEYDMNEGSKYCFKYVRLSKGRLKEIYPSKAKLIDGFCKDEDDNVENGSGILQEGSDDDYGNRPNVTTQVQRSGDEGAPELKQDEKFTVKEYWRTKLVEKFFVIDRESGEPERFDTKEEAAKFISEQGAGESIARKVDEMWVAAYCCGYLLQDEKSPFDWIYKKAYLYFKV